MEDDSKTLMQCLRPLLTSMKLFGMYFIRRSDDSLDRKWCRCNGWMIYAVFVLVLLWLNAARMFSVFTSEDAFGMVFLNKMICVIWAIQCAISQTAFYASSHLGTLEKVFLKAKLSDDCALYLRKIVVVYTVVGWSAIVGCSAFFVYGIFFSDGFVDFMLAPFQVYIVLSDPLAPRIIVCVLILYLVSAHIFSHAMTFLLAKMVSYQFRRVNGVLESCLDSQDGLVEDSEIETIRQQHQEVAMSVSRIDDVLMFANASAFCCQLSCVIIILYIIVFYRSFVGDPVLISAFVFWMVTMSFGLTLTAAGGIMINYYVSKSFADCCTSKIFTPTRLGSGVLPSVCLSVSLDVCLFVFLCAIAVLRYRGGGV